MKLLLQIILITIFSLSFIGCGVDDSNVSTEENSQKTTLLINESGVFKSSASVKALDKNSTVKITKNIESDEMTVVVITGSVEITE